MANCKYYKDKVIGVYGLARTGAAAITSLLGGGAKVIAWDDCPEVITDIQLKFQTQIKDLLIIPIGEKWKIVDAILISPGIPLSNERKKELQSMLGSKPMLCDIEFLYREVKSSKFIGITGTNGKSTTTALINHVLTEAGLTNFMGGNIGIPAIQLPAATKANYVLEVSSFQLDLLNKTKFDIAILLSITPDHLDRHGTFKNYVNSKKKIFNNQNEFCFSIISCDNNTGKRILSEVQNKELSTVIPISNQDTLEKGVSVISGILYNNYDSGKWYDVSNIDSLLGKHNAENMAAAFACCYLLGVPADQIVQNFRSFKALPHRMHLFHKRGNLIFVDDSKATNADSSYWALKTFDNIYWIAGGISKDGSIRVLAPFFEKITHAYLIGESAPELAKVLSQYNVSYSIVGTLTNAVTSIMSKNLESGTVLLSPSCSSLDQWKNYEERGNHFIKMVKENWPN
jgi:UDP-N-acetylmuramoylalanine--D-glutamate ligase